MKSLEKRIERWGLKSWGFTDVALALHKAVVEGKMTPAAVARTVGGTVAAVRYCLDKHNIPYKKREHALSQALAQRGYRSTTDFFRQHGTLGFAEMGAKLGVPAHTVSRYYREWVRAREEAGDVLARA